MSVFENTQKLPCFHEVREEVIPRKVMGRILEAGRMAPSPGNVQSVEFVVVEDEGKKEMLHRATDDHRVQDAPTSVLVISDIERMRRSIGEKAEQYSYSEVASAIQNMRLVAAENDLASVWVGGFDERLLNSKFGVPEGKRVEAIVSFGYTDNPEYPEEKFGLNSVCFYDEYGNQVDSFFDSPGWRGLETEAKIQNKKLRSAYGSLKRKFQSLLE